MEHRTLKEEVEVIEDVQEQMNNIDHKLGYESNYETLLKFYLAVKRLKKVRPKYDLNGFLKLLESLLSKRIFFS